VRQFVAGDDFAVAKSELRDDVHLGGSSFDGFACYDVIREHDVLILCECLEAKAHGPDRLLERLEMPQKLLESQFLAIDRLDVARG
jgi:hypothetical protein